MGENELYHHGVVGMKWGVRRYQNKDSTLTEAGKRQNAKQKEKYEKKYAKTKELTPDEKKAKVLKSRSVKQLYKHADLFTSDELKSAYDRLRLERDIASLSQKEVNKGKEFVDKAISTAKTTSDAIQTGTNLYNNVAKVYNSFSGSKDKLPVIGEKKESYTDLLNKKINRLDAERRYKDLSDTEYNDLQREYRKLVTKKQYEKLLKESTV